MESQIYLTFELNSLWYGLKIDHIREIFKLPELTPIADAPGDIIGILNLRGDILPVMHLAKRLGQTVPACQVSDSVIVIEWQGVCVGMVVNWVHGVQALPSSMIEPVPTYEYRNSVNLAFASGVAEIDDHLVLLLNPESLIRQTDEVSMMAWEANLDNMDDERNTPYPDEQMVDTQQQPAFTNFFSRCHPNITLEEKAIFHQRAVHLRHTLESSDVSELIPLAVVELEGEYFCLELQQIQEFINIPRMQPIPCCPPHIMGNINLRGEIMTLIDIRQALDLTHTVENISKAVIIEVDEIVAGIMVDQVLDVIYLTSSEITEVPTTLPKSYQTFFQGTTQYHQKSLSVLDLSQVLFQGDLVVDQVA